MWCIIFFSNFVYDPKVYLNKRVNLPFVFDIDVLFRKIFIQINLIFAILISWGVNGSENEGQLTL